MKIKIAIINGANLNFLGIREPEIYGKENLEAINEKIRIESSKSNVELDFFQSNIEGEIINKIQSLYKKCDYIIINPGGFTHYSIGIRDAILSVGIKTIEVHISNINNREEFRKNSVISDISIGTVSGFGNYGYLMAVNYIIDKEKEMN